MRVTENIKAWKTLLALSAGEGFFSAAVAVDKDMAACSRMIGRLEADLGIDLMTIRTDRYNSRHRVERFYPMQKRSLTHTADLKKLPGNVWQCRLSCAWAFP